MADLTTAALVAQIVVGAAVLAMISYAAFEFRRYHARQEASAAMDTIRTMLSHDFLESVQVFYGMPDDLAADDVYRDPSRHQAATTVGFHYEVIGYMVFRGIVPLRMVAQLTGPSAQMAWTKLSDWVDSVRTERGSPQAYEWFEWLALQLDKHPVPGKTGPAPQSYADWRPQH